MTTSTTARTVTIRRAEPLPVRVAVLSAADPAGRYGRLVTDWFLATIAGRADTVTAVLPVREAARDHAKLSRTVGGADAVILVTPEHNHSFPGELKTVIDALREEWVTTPVAVVSYGGVSGGLRATEQLRLVFAELHTLVVRETLGIANVHAAFAPDGQPHDADELRRAADRLVTNLTWWARTLRAGREREPYPGPSAPRNG